MRAYIDIINEALAGQHLGTREEVEANFERQFWRPVRSTGRTEVWQHMDDPALGEYHVFFDGGTVNAIEFHYPPMPMMDRQFASMAEFSTHLDGITEEPVDQVARMKGTAKLAGIAHELRRKKRAIGKRGLTRHDRAQS